MDTQLLAEMEFLNAVVEKAGALVVVLDKKGHICLFNQACEKISGLSFSEVKGKFPWETFLPIEDAENIRKNAFEELANNPEKTADRYTNYWLNKSGERFLIEWSNTLLFDSEGAMEFMVSIGTDITERYHTEQQLHIKDAALEHSLTAMAISDLEGKLTYVNPAFLKMWGYSSSHHVIGRLATEFWVRPEEAANVIATMLQQNHWTGELEALRADGTTFTAELQSSMVNDTSGQPQYFLGSFLDITKRKTAEAALISSTEQLNEAQRLAKVGSWELDLVNNELTWSDEIYRIFEMDKSSFGASYEAFLNAIHPDDREMVDKAYSDSLATQKPYDIVHRLQMADGRIKYVRETCESYFDANGKPLRSMGTVQDISELHQVELELRKHREHLEEMVRERTAEVEFHAQRNETILNTTPDGFFASDMNGNICSSNPAYCAMLGYTLDELLQITIADIEGKESQEEVSTHIQKIYDQGHDRFDTQHRCKDGSLLDVEVTVSLVTISGESLFYAFVRDITARKKSEEALILARDEAERSSKAKSEFLSRMSHELRTPMNAILGFAQVLEMDSLQPKQLKFVEEIHRAGNHLLELINELLDLSRIEVGQLNLAVQATMLAPVIKQAIQITLPLTNVQQIKLTNNCKQNVSVMADETRLRQILVNLLSNAIKYNRPGGQVTIDCEFYTEGKLRLQVADTGKGVAPDLMHNLFQPFERLGAEYTEVQGSGIGLA
ncbi:MAG: PAS domain S-box protein, partial [Gammaproteobacteria bacterium]|nr:PAS domain S-box protein [Gammaproteobacteria bacterium]